LGIGDWGLGIGDWGLGIGPNPHLIERDFENNKNINEKYKENKNDIIYNYNIISNKNDIDEFKGKNTFVKHINITNSQIKNMENIFDDFKVQTMEVK